MKLPSRIGNFIQGQEYIGAQSELLQKFDPRTGEPLVSVASATEDCVGRAVEAASAAFRAWSATPGVQRGMLLHSLVRAMIEAEAELAEAVHRDTGKSLANAKGEVGAAIQLGLFFASEGQRLYGKTTTSGVAQRLAMMVRQPIGPGALIVSANTPIANIAWKIFPALVCGNTAVLKVPEDAPCTAWRFAELCRNVLPPGVLNIVHGTGSLAGAALVRNPRIRFVSFTGSTTVGRWILQQASDRLLRVSLELGGKNPFFVCDDADLEKAVHWAALSAFSNAGQRCASGSRIIVMDAVYEKFRALFLAKAATLRVGSGDADDLGPVVSRRQLEKIEQMVERASAAGAKVLAGGKRLTGGTYGNGFFYAPTVLEGSSPADEISREEVFGPVTNLYRVRDFASGLALCNDSSYGLTAAIHTKSHDRANHFAQEAEAGIVSVNGGTFGSEPHMPFGGRKLSGNGTREPGTEALDVYSEWKNVVFNYSAENL